MKKVKNEFSSEREKEEYVAYCEMEFEKKLDAVSEQLLSCDGLRLLTLSGPTCSCKSTAVKKLIADMVDAGRKIKIISLDDFFRSRTENRDDALARAEPIDFDSIDALDFPYLCTCLDAMFEGRPVMLPVFDFMSAKRAGYTEYRPAQDELIVFEGIQAVYPEITERLSGIPHRSIYLDVIGPIEAEGEVFSGRTVRLCRRLVRDARYRNARPEFTMFLWESVTQNEDRNMIPYAGGADLHIDSFLGCELGILRDPLTELLSAVSEDDRYYAQAAELIARFAPITPIRAEYLSHDSMYHEFL